jgi:DNA-binding transcriptional ArsR family regulator
VPPTSEAPASSDESAVVLTEAATVRALAHPARLAVIDALYSGDELTATECAALAGTSPSAMSYHLRALERFGVVERAAARGDGRQRPWRRAGSSLRIDLTAGSSGQGAAAATELLIEATMAEDRRRLIAAVSGDPGDESDQRWRRATAYDRMQVLVTPEEGRQLLTAVEELLTPYAAESRSDPPVGARRMAFSVMLVREPSQR